MASEEYHHGEMDIHEQVETYRAVMNGTKWGSLALAVAILALVLWFCTPSGFFGGLIPALALLVVGIVVMRGSKGGGH